MRMGEIPLGFTEEQYRGDPPPPKRQGGREFTLWDKDGFGFGDILDVVNPLQHIPVVSVFYRELTGDDIGPLPRLLGGGLFGGILGAASSLANILIEDATGNDMGGHVMTALFNSDGGGGPVEPPIMVARSAAKSGSAAYKTASELQPRPVVQQIGLSMNQDDVLV